MNQLPEVGVYWRDGGWITNVSFNHHWQARVFCAMLKLSLFHAGRKN